MLGTRPSGCGRGGTALGRWCLLLASLCLVLVCCPAVAAAQSPPPDITGAWQNEADSSSPPWSLTTSNGLRTLNASWRGGPGHPTLRGSLNAQLVQQFSVPAYIGRFDVTEDQTQPDGTTKPITVTGNVSVKVEADDRIEIILQADNGGAGEDFTFVRTSSIAVAPTPTRFGRTVSMPAPPPGSPTVESSPDLGNAPAATVTEGGVSAQDVTFAALLQAARDYCYVQAVRGLSQAIRQNPPTPDEIDPASEKYQRDLQAIGAAVYVQVASCMAAAETYADIIATLTSASAATAHSSAACPVKPITLTGKTRIRKAHVGGLKGISASCTFRGGVLKLRVASKSGKPLRKLIGPRLFVGLARSKNDAPGGRLSFSFHKG